MNLSSPSARAVHCSVLTLTFFAAVLLLSPNQAQSAVSGFCSNCHTMHNSQDGAMVYTGGPAGNLLTNDCVGCHTSITADTIVNNTPIVFNTMTPTNPLAGGNFFWVSGIDPDNDKYGHNVLGISNGDIALSAGNPGGPGCTWGCHDSLAYTEAEIDPQYVEYTGCRGCHSQIKHHGTDPPDGEPETAASGWYRFLVPRQEHINSNGGGPVAGIEAAYWEQNADANDHNIYYKGDGSDQEVPAGSLGKFCAGCHLSFHSPGVPYYGGGIDWGGGGDPWLRHPTDFAISDAVGTEYSPIIGTAYDPIVPVGKSLGQTPADKAKVVTGDTVMCMSCHRAHGSPYPDMLRWDYTEMLTGAGVGIAGTGCFKCHTAKDGA